MKVGGLIANRNLWVSHLWHDHYPIDLSDCGGAKTWFQAQSGLNGSELWFSRHRGKAAIRRSCSFIYLAIVFGVH